MRTSIRFIFILMLIQAFYPASAQTYRILVTPEKTTKSVYIDLSGKVILDPDSKYCYDYSTEGTAITLTKDVNLFDVSGNRIIPEFDFKIAFEDLVYTVIPIVYSSGILRTKYKGKWGGMDSKGKTAIPFIYDNLTDFYGGYALARKDDSFYVINTKGEEILIEGYTITQIKHFSEGLAPIEVKGQLFGFVDTFGKVVITPQFQGVGYFNAGYAWARTFDDIIGIIDKNGRWKVEPQFDVVKNFDVESGMAMVKKKASQNQYDYLDTEGIIRTFDETEETFDFSNGLAMGKKGDKYGYLNNKGDWEIMPIYENIANFNNGYASVKLNGSWGLIDKKGKTVLQPAYKYVGPVVIID